jgi:hypothetical protein
LTLNEKFGLSPPCQTNVKVESGANPKIYKSTKRKKPNQQIPRFTLPKSPLFFNIEPSKDLIEIKKRFLRQEYDEIRYLLMKNSRILPKEIHQEQLKFAQKLFSTKNFTLKLE